MTLTELAKGRLTLPLILFVATVLSRLPFASRMLFHMDSVQYALALKQYDIGLHQPHPPGYFVYVVLGRMMQWIVPDPNMAFVSLSILFTAGTVIVVYLLARALFDDRSALISAVFAMTSPNLWFYGEIAMNYGLESFFSAAIAYACWQVHTRKDARYLAVLVILLGLSGGVRQNTPVFLFPLVLYACKEMPLRSLLLAILALCAVSLGWFVPMLVSTGGWEAYRGAFHELLQFHVGPQSVFETGVAKLVLHARALITFLVYGMGGGFVLLLFSFYVMVRRCAFDDMRRDLLSFFACWIAPAFCFYLFVVIHPGNPGHVLVIMPPFFILLTQALRYLHQELSALLPWQWHRTMVLLVVSTNLYIFLASELQVSSRFIRAHDHNLQAIISRFRAFNPENTVLFITPYSYYGFRHIMYYVPEYFVCSPQLIGMKGQKRVYFAGMNRETIRMDTITIPPKIDTFASLAMNSDTNGMHDSSGIRIDVVNQESYVFSGSITHALRLFPDLPLKIGQDIAIRYTGNGGNHPL